jgi:hypothetical protein
VYLFGGFTLLLAFGRTICSMVICEGGITTLSCNPLPSQNPRSPWTSPLGLTTLNRKNHPIVVTLGGIGSCYASLTLQFITFYPCYKFCNNSHQNHNAINQTISTIEATNINTPKYHATRVSTIANYRAVENSKKLKTK